MANTIKYSSLVLSQVAEILHETAFMYKRAYKDISGSFTKNSGNSITIPKPNRPAVGTSADITSLSRDMYEDGVALTLVRRNSAVDITSAERTYKLGGEDMVRERIAMPCAKALARQINIVGINTLWGAGGQRVARADYTTALSYADAANLNAKLSQGLAPDYNRNIVLSHGDWAAAAAGMSGYFNPQTVLSDSLKAGGVQGQLAGMDWIPTSSMPSYTTAISDNTGTVNDTVAEGDSEITLAGLQASGTIYAGQAFTVAGVYAIDPETQQSTGQLFTFVAAANATISSNAATVTLQRPIYTTSTNRTLANVSALPGNGAVVTILDGAITKAGSSIIAWQDNALAFASVDLAKGDDYGMPSESVTIDGLTLRLMRYGNGLTDVFGTRIDIEFGFAAVYPELIATTAGKLV